MKIKTAIIIYLLSCCIVGAQETGVEGTPSGEIVLNYLTEAKDYAALYNGKIETPYDLPFANHPYFETEGYIKSELGYNNLVYRDVLVRIDLYRNEITVIQPNRPFRFVLNNKKFNYAILNGSTIVMSNDDKTTTDKFMVLLYNGNYPVTRKYKMRIKEESSTNDRVVIRTFDIQKQYAIYINGVPRAVKTKNSLLKLFPDKKKELNEYVKQHKLNFSSQIEQSIITIVKLYEDLNK